MAKKVTRLQSYQKYENKYTIKEVKLDSIKAVVTEITTISDKENDEYNKIMSTTSEPSDNNSDYINLIADTIITKQLY